jgi:uncharacterized membrane protein YheB (UPF0754 family)
MLKRLLARLWKTPGPEPEHNWKPELIRMTAVLEQALEREASLNDAVRDLTDKAETHDLQLEHKVYELQKQLRDMEFDRKALRTQLRGRSYVVNIANSVNRLVAANTDWFTSDQQKEMLASLNAATEAIDHAEFVRDASGI